MSVDLSENESNIDMGGMDDETSARENGGKKRRKRKQEDYDKEDDFIDDTELAWEQQALMAKDGFFVYSGPLVTEEKPAVERYVRSDSSVERTQADILLEPMALFGAGADEDAAVPYEESQQPEAAAVAMVLALEEARLSANLASLKLTVP